MRLVDTMLEHWRPLNEPPWYSFRRVPRSTGRSPSTAGKQSNSKSINKLTRNNFSAVEGEDKVAGLNSLSRESAAWSSLRSFSESSSSWTSRIKVQRAKDSHSLDAEMQ